MCIRLTTLRLASRFEAEKELGGAVSNWLWESPFYCLLHTVSWSLRLFKQTWWEQPEEGIAGRDGHSQSWEGLIPGSGRLLARSQLTPDLGVFSKNKQTIVWLL